VGWTVSFVGTLTREADRTQRCDGMCARHGTRQITDSLGCCIGDGERVSLTCRWRSAPNVNMLRAQCVRWIERHKRFGGKGIYTYVWQLNRRWAGHGIGRQPVPVIGGDGEDGNGCDSNDVHDHEPPAIAFEQSGVTEHGNVCIGSAQTTHSGGNTRLHVQVVVERGIFRTDRLARACARGCIRDVTMRTVARSKASGLSDSNGECNGPSEQ